MLLRFSRSIPLIALLLPLAGSGLLLAQTPAGKTMGESSSRGVQSAPLAPENAVLAAVNAEIEARLQAREALPRYFAEAYRQYPRLPEGVLEAVAFVGSRWIHLTPESPVGGHHGMPQAYGVMGLYRGIGGFSNGVSEAARALGVSEDLVIQDVRTNILASAARLNQLMEQAGLRSTSIELLGPVLEEFSGISATGTANRFARKSYVYDLLLTLDRGHDDHGIRIVSRPIDFALAFDDATLELMRAPLVRYEMDTDRLYAVPGSEGWNKAMQSALGTGAGDIRANTLPSDATAKTAPQTTDYAPALWVTSPNYSSRNGSAITNVAIHTMQGSYSGGISWCSNPDSDVSAHYMMRSSDGQVTQMVREYDKAWHVGSENYYTVGIEHEGYVSTSSYYTTAMYNSSSALTRDICASNKIDCTTCYGGASSSTTQVLSISYRVKGHQHYPNQDHTDPGIYWDWAKYKSMVSSGSSSGGSGGGSTGSTGTTTILDNFESSEGHFNLTPTYSGSTTGISTSSTAERSTAAKKNGSYSERLMLVDNTSSSSNWVVRFLSGSGSASQNVSLTRSGGRVGFWAYTTASGVSVSVLIDDGSAIESATSKSLPASAWTYFEWKLDDAAQWNNYYNGNGTIDASSVTIDALLFSRAQTSSTVYLYIDDVQYKR